MCIQNAGKQKITSVRKTSIIVGTIEIWKIYSLIFWLSVIAFTLHIMTLYSILMHGDY